MAAEESGELRADGEPVGVGGQRAPAGLPGARPGTGTNEASAKACGVGPLPPRRKVPIAGPKGHVCPPDRNTTPFEPQTVRARTQETPAWPKHSKRTVNELKKRPCLCIRGRKKRVFGQSLPINTSCSLASKRGGKQVVVIVGVFIIGRESRGGWDRRPTPHAHPPLLPLFVEVGVVGRSRRTHICCEIKSDFRNTSPSLKSALIDPIYPSLWVRLLA